MEFGKFKIHPSVVITVVVATAVYLCFSNFLELF
jgi:hypothetical protein